jgi:glutamate 5-kinase
MSQLAHKPGIVAQARRVVVKVGSAVLSDARGLLPDVIAQLAGEVDSIVRRGREVVLVTSGAIAAGRAQMGRPAGSAMAARQAAAAVGQIELMGLWARYFGERGRLVGQLLLTHQDFAERARRLNATHTLRELLRAGAIPIVNENDTVSVDEIRLGDNDVLSSLVATMIQANLLIILTDVPGILTGDPRKRHDAQLIPVIAEPNAEMQGLVAERPGPLGSGGMAAKVKAAQQAARGGIAVMVAPGRQPKVLERLLDPAGELGTLVLPSANRLKSRKHWIAYVLRPAGALSVDKGASEALLTRGRSLLPSGIRDVAGNFEGGDCVSVLGQDGRELARGLVNYPAADVTKLRGRHSREIARLLGYKVADEIVHRDNLVLLGERT